MYGVYLLLITLPALYDAQETPCGAKVVGGTGLDGGTYTELDTTSGAGYLAKAYKVGCCGLLSAWNVKIAAKGTIHLQIWRSSGTSYTLVHSNTYTFSTDDALKVQTLPIDAADRPTLLTDDIIGWFVPSPATDMVEYFNGAGAVDQNYRVATGSSSGPVDFSSGSLLNGRSYAININVVPNTPPEFTNLPATVSYLDTKFINTGVYLYQLTFTDVDKDDTTLTAVREDETTGYGLDLRYRISTRASNYEVGTFYLKYILKDQCENTVIDTLTLMINNTEPEFKNTAFTTTVEENNNAETQLMQMTVTDKQAYTCVVGSTDPSDGIFIVKQTSGTSPYYLYLLSGSKSKMFYDTKPQYQVNVVCTDIPYGLTSERTFTVNVIRNEPPTINALPLTVTKSTLTTNKDDTIYQVDVTDADSPSSALRYSMTCSPAACPFQINSETGQITATQDLNLHKTSPYDVYITTSDERRTTGPETLTVVLTDINEIPIISNPTASIQTVNIDENIDGDTTVGRAAYDVDLTDGNAGDTHTFTGTFSQSQTACSSYYAIDESTGVITTLATLNYETMKTSVPSLESCDMIVTVNDGRENSVQKKLKIVVKDVNEQQTGFHEAQYTIEGTEGQAGNVLPTPGFIVNDVDINDKQTYSMDCGNRDSKFFTMDPATGTVTQTRQYDLDQFNIRIYTIKCTVTATDKGGHTVETTLNIRISEENDNPPVFSQAIYYSTVPHTTPAGSAVHKCASTDADVQDVHTETHYTLDSPYFTVDNNCNIRVATDLSQLSPIPQTIDVTLTATNTDDPTKTDVSTFRVVITDVTTTTVVTTVNNNNNNNNNNNGNTGNSGDSGSPAAFLEDPADLAWFIPAMLALAAMLGLLAYMIYRCCRVPGFCGRLFSDMCGCFNNRDCCGRSTKGSGRITNPKSARQNNASSDKSEPRKKANKVEKPQKPIQIRDPAKIDGKYEWNTWATSDFSNKTVEFR